MRNILLTLCYDGRNYHGWQVQENALTVQEVFQNAWQQICGSRDNVIGCSRTDAGVHANMFCCNVRTESPISCEKLRTALNAVLPFDIAVNEVREVPLEFHARYSCVSKEYIYKIHTSPVRSPFLHGFAYEHKYPLNIEKMNEAAKQIIGTHDFTSFCAAGSSVESNVRTVYACRFTQEEDTVTLHIEADGFLYNMVRIIAGTLIDVSRGKIPVDGVDAIIASKNRENAGVTAPACGLYLNRVNYEASSEGAIK